MTCAFMTLGSDQDLRTPAVLCAKLSWLGELSQRWEANSFA